jgi:hypothetical protein
MLSKVPNERDLRKVAQFLQDADNDQTKRQDLVDLMNYWEHLSAGVNSGVYDIGIVNRTVGGTVISVGDVYREFILKARATRNRPRLYAEIEELAGRVQKLRDRP